jgi:CubicO group peptidase (beta-lactamase class C family)
MSDFQDRFGRCLDLFADARDKDGSPLAMFAFAANADSERRNHVFLDHDREADLRSVSKVVAALVLGSLIARETQINGAPIALDTRVEPLLRQHMSDSARRQWVDVRILDLLNNTIGHEEGFLFRKDLGNLPQSEYLAYVFDVPVRHAPGTHFSYSNVGPFLFSVIVQDWLGTSLHAVAQATIFAPLEISGDWRLFGDYSAGCTGLSMRNADLIKLATLLRDGGTTNGASIVPRSWITTMSSPISLTPHMFDPGRVFPKHAYGIGLWVCENGAYYCDGTNGQYLIVIPDRGVALSTTGDQPDMKPITKCMLPFVSQ